MTSLPILSSIKHLASGRQVIGATAACTSLVLQVYQHCFVDTVGNFSWKDWATFAGTSAACYPFGWAVGKCAFALLTVIRMVRLHISAHTLPLTGVGPKVPKQSAIMGAMIGGLGGFMLAYQQSAGESHGSLQLVRSLCLLAASRSLFGCGNMTFAPSLSLL